MTKIRNRNVATNNRNGTKNFLIQTDSDLKFFYSVPFRFLVFRIRHFLDTFRFRILVIFVPKNKVQDFRFSVPVPIPALRTNRLVLYCEIIKESSCKYLLINFVKNQYVLKYQTSLLLCK